MNAETPANVVPINASVRISDTETKPVRIDIVGEASYQTALARIAGPKTADGMSVWKTAQLTPEPGNAHDKNAVMVTIDGLKVGYLSRRQALAYHRMMADAGMQDEALAEVRVHIMGGWRRPNGDEGHYGVALYVPQIVATHLED
jgi:HIRAN domain